MSPESIPWIIFGYGRVGHLLEQLCIEVMRSSPMTTLRAILSTSPDNLTTPSGAPLVALSPDFSDYDQILDSFEFPTRCAVWLVVPDDAILPLAARLLPRLSHDSYLLHCSGSLPSTAMRPSTADNIAPRIASLHPLFSVPIDVTPATLTAAKSALWTIEGDPDAVNYVTQLVELIGICPRVIDPSRKPLYHAAAVAACGLLTSTFDLAVSFATTAGFDYNDAVSILKPLAESTLQQWRCDVPIRDVLTGPVARGDIGVVERHLNAFVQHGLDPATIELYRQLALRHAEGEMRDYLVKWTSDSGTR